MSSKTLKSLSRFKFFGKAVHSIDPFASTGAFPGIDRTPSTQSSPFLSRLKRVVARRRDAMLSGADDAKGRLHDFIDMMLELETDKAIGGASPSDQGSMLAVAKALTADEVRSRKEGGL